MPFEEIRYRLSAVAFTFLFGWSFTDAFLLQMGEEARAATLVICAGMVILAHLVVFNKVERPISLLKIATHVLAGLTWLLCSLVATIHWYLAVRGLTFTGWFDYRMGLIILMWVMGFMEAQRTWRQIR